MEGGGVKDSRAQTDVNLKNDPIIDTVNMKNDTTLTADCNVQILGERRLNFDTFLLKTKGESFPII